MSLAPYPAQVCEARQRARDRAALALPRLTATARENGVSDAALKAVVLSLGSPEIGLLDEVEVQALIDRFEVNAA